MPTVFSVFGWRFFFYANEGKEPIHIHCKSGEKECKFWLDQKNFDIYEEFSFNLSPKDRRLVKKLVFQYFEFIEEKWAEFQRRKSE